MSVRGTVRVGGDKSISHRAAILAALAHGTSRIRNFSRAGDCDSTLSVLRALGVKAEGRADEVEIVGLGARAFVPPPAPLDCGRSGTTMRLAAGALAPARLEATLTGHAQLLRRPMRRVAEPLRRLGAYVRLVDGERAPMTIRGADLAGTTYRLPVASAQVKSAILIAGLHASGETTVVEPVPTRDHTERLLGAMGAPCAERRLADGRAITVRAGALGPLRLDVPGDLSSAAPLIAAAALLPGSDLVVEEVGLNPTRTGLLDALRRMGADIETETRAGSPEPTGSVRVRQRALHATNVDALEVPAIVDELPLLALVATQAEGATTVRGAAELRAKESDRIGMLLRGLRLLGADVEELPDGFVVRGPTRLGGGAVDSATDHRIAMTFVVAGLIADGPVRVSDLDYVADSFPGFLDALRAVAA